jgi:hypothetical protein
MHEDDTEEPPDDVEELSEIIEFGRRADELRSGIVPTNELRNFGAVRERKKNKLDTLHSNSPNLLIYFYLFQAERS